MGRSTNAAATLALLWSFAGPGTPMPAGAAAPAISKVTNPGAPGSPDGIQPGGDRENSYAWSMEAFRQPDGEYLWVGSNRNLLYLILRAGKLANQQITDAFQGAVGIPAGTQSTPPAPDFGARIFRYRTDGAKPWELVYQSPLLPNPVPNPLLPPLVPLDAGFRGMQVYAGPDLTDPALYAVGFGGSLGYTRVIKFPRSFVTGDQPAEVLRIGGTQSLRAITVHDKRLCVGTFGNEVWCNDRPQEQLPFNPLVPATATATAGWEKIAGPADFGLGSPSPLTGIWQFISYNGWLYVFVGNGVDVRNPGAAGFMVFKGRGGPSGWEWHTIVGDGGRYPKGLGSPLNAAASPFLFKGKVYVGTFFDVPGIAVQGAGGMAFLAANWRPAQIYRFDAGDTWQMVIGDPNPLFPRRVGNSGAGFFNPSSLQRLLLPPPLDKANLSLAGYVWWMAEYRGRLYASTFDMRVVLDLLDESSLTALGVTDPALVAHLQSLKNLLGQFNTNPAGFDLYSTADGVNWSAVTRDGLGDPYNYGGRTLKATNRGLFVGTANPFFGAQVWRLRHK